jgi:hypothetical protein
VASGPESALLVHIGDSPTGGRVDLDLVAGYRYPEYELFDADISRRYTTTDRRVTDPSGVWMPGIASVALVVVHVERPPA